MSGSKKLPLLMKQSKSSHCALILALVVQPFEPLPEVQELQVHFEGMGRDTVVAKDKVLGLSVYRACPFTAERT